MSDAAVEAKHLVKTFRIGFRRKRIEAVRDVSFRVAANEVLGIIGPNGAGKTTTLKMLTGLVRPDSGSALVFGADVSLPQNRRRMGYLPESPYFYEHLKAQELLRFYGQLTGVEGRTLGRRIEELLELVGLADARDRPIRKFSKGMRQRVGLAQALINDPDVVILDEPQTGLDPTGRKEVRDLIAGLKRRGKSVLFSSHILPDVEAVCDRVVVIHRGRLREQGALSDLTGDRVTRWEVVARDCDLASHDLEGLLEFERRGEAFVGWFDGSMGVERIVQSIAALGGTTWSVTPQRTDLEHVYLRDTAGEGNGEKSTDSDPLDRDQHVS